MLWQHVKQHLLTQSRCAAPNAHTTHAKLWNLKALLNLIYAVMRFKEISHTVIIPEVHTVNSASPDYAFWIVYSDALRGTKHSQFPISDGFICITAKRAQNEQHTISIKYI